MVDPFAIVPSILGFLQNIKNKVQLFRHNRESCKSIVEVVDNASRIVKSLKQQPPPPPIMIDMLKGLEETLERSLKTVEECENKNVFLRFLDAGEIAERLRQVREDISLGLIMVSTAAAAATYNTSVSASVNERVDALHANMKARFDAIDANMKKLLVAVPARDASVSGRSTVASLIKKIANDLPDGSLPREVQGLVQTYSYDANYHQRMKTESARQCTRSAPRGDGKGNNLTSVESVTGQSIKKASTSVSKLVNMHAVAIPAAPPELKRIVSLSEVPGETVSYKINSRPSNSSRLLEVYPLTHRFPSDRIKETTECPVTITNKMDHYVGVWIKPTNGQFTKKTVIMEPHSTLVVSVTMKMHEQRPHKGMFEVLMIAVQSKDNLEKIESSIRGKKHIDNEFMRQVEKQRAMVYRAMMLIAMTCEPPRWKIIPRSTKNMDLDLVRSVDGHPSKPWIVTTDEGGSVFIWDYHKQKTMMELQVTRVPDQIDSFLHEVGQFIKETSASHWLCSAKFIASKKWLAVGAGNGYIYIYDCTNAELVKTIKAYGTGKSVDSLDVHPTKPYLLSSSSHDGNIKLWDWSREWKKIKEFKASTVGYHKDGVRGLKFNPNDTNTFACVTYASKAKVFNIESSSLTTTLNGPFNADYFCSHRENQHQLLVTLSSPNYGPMASKSEIRDFQTENVVHALSVSGRKMRRVACHPTLPIFATALDDGTICLWNAITYRLEKMVHSTDRDCGALVFITCTDGTTRLVATFGSKIKLIEVNLPMANTRQRTIAGGK